jgi:hypothetical protein
VSHVLNHFSLSYLRLILTSSSIDTKVASILVVIVGTEGGRRVLAELSRKERVRVPGTGAVAIVRSRTVSLLNDHTATAIVAVIVGTARFCFELAQTAMISFGAHAVLMIMIDLVSKAIIQ